jgi:hypothetical protein
MFICEFSQVSFNGQVTTVNVHAAVGNVPITFKGKISTFKLLFQRIFLVRKISSYVPKLLLSLSSAQPLNSGLQMTFSTYFRPGQWTTPKEVLFDGELSNSVYNFESY